MGNIYCGALVSSDYLAHHGIKGMRWGVRRFQREDGSLTSSGKKRKLMNERNNEAGEHKSALKSAGHKALGKVYELNEKAYNKLGNKTLAPAKTDAGSKLKKGSGGNSVVNGLKAAQKTARGITNKMDKAAIKSSKRWQKDNASSIKSGKKLVAKGENEYTQYAKHMAKAAGIAIGSAALQRAVFKSGAGFTVKNHYVPVNKIASDTIFAGAVALSALNNHNYKKNMKNIDNFRKDQRISKKNRRREARVKRYEEKYE